MELHSHCYFFSINKYVSFTVYSYFLQTAFFKINLFQRKIRILCTICFNHFQNKFKLTMKNQTFFFMIKFVNFCYLHIHGAKKNSLTPYIYLLFILFIILGCKQRFIFNSGDPSTRVSIII